jgi:hypothetical protein
LSSIVDYINNQKKHHADNTLNLTMENIALDGFTTLSHPGFLTVVLPSHASPGRRIGNGAIVNTHATAMKRM